MTQVTAQWSTHEDPFHPMDPHVRAVAEAWFDVDRLHLPAPRGLIVGESPRAGGNPRLPLWPWPKTSSGGRLLDMSGMTLVTYLSRLARVNLAYEPVSRWNPTHARLRAQWIAAKMPKNSRILALGARVRDAFGIPEFFTPAPISDCGILVPPDWAQMVAIPHPSGRNLTYNEPEAREEARRWIRWTARLR